MFIIPYAPALSSGKAGALYFYIGGDFMDNTVLTALIGLGGSALGSLFGVLASSKLTQYRLAQLEKGGGPQQPH